MTITSISLMKEKTIYFLKRKWGDNLKSYFFLVTLGLSLILAACGQGDSSEGIEKNQVKQTETQNSSIEQQEEKDNSQFLATNEFFEPFNGKIDHVHGIGYAGDQGIPFFAAHDGLKLYDNGKWFKTKKENNDYMGFNATNNGFYSSGHPGVDSNLPNPIGIQRSNDNGKTLESLGLEGEVDFHLMGVGYNNETIFVMSPQKSSLMDANTFYVSEDDAKTWKEVAGNSLDDELISVAVHPMDGNFIAAAGQKGIYLSKDKGENFELITRKKQGTSAFFTNDNLIFGTFDGEASLTRYSLKDNSEEEISLPEMKQDAVLYFARNPQNEKEMTFVSFNGNIYQTKDNAQNWKLLVENGALK